ncbi:MAG: FAD-binding oxidoreductase [Chloroflexi bacterium]|nr:FAD-binding oxidoreductase [Chloroflexota bacterium]
MTQAENGGQSAALDFEQHLAGAVPEWRALDPADDTYLIDGVRPRLMCAPTSVDEVAGAVTAANTAGAAVVPWGGGTRMGLGFPPGRADLVLRTDRLTEIIEYEPADLVVTVQAGITLAALQARLRAEGQMLALDPAAADRATIGGLTSTNASGPLRFMYGTARDLVIGTRVVNADGVISKAGGRVVKNVAGYDLNKLYIGALGTVGIVVELSFRLHPLPQAQGMLLAAFGRAEEASEAIQRLVRSPLGPAAIELLDAEAARALGADVDVSDDGCLLVVAATGFEKAVQRQLNDIRGLCAAASATDTVRDDARLDSLWSGLREFADPSTKEVALLKVAVPPARGALALAAARREARAAGFTPAAQARAGNGVVYLKLQPRAWDDEGIRRLGRLVEQLRAYARGEGGSLVVEACPAAAKTGTGAVDVWGDPGSGFPVMRALKENLDPKGTLNPGRFVNHL